MTEPTDALETHADAKATRNAALRRYRASPEGQAALKRYNASPAALAARQKYAASPKGKAAQQRAHAEKRVDPDAYADHTLRDLTWWETRRHEDL